MNKDLLEIAERACARARKAGARDAAASVTLRREVRVVVQDGLLEELKSSESRSLNLRVYVNDRYGNHLTSDLSPEAMGRFIDGAVDLTRVLMPDPLRRLPEPSFYEGRSTADLGLFDPDHARFSMQERKDVARAIHDRARTDAGTRVISVGAGLADQVTEWARVQTNGFSDGDRQTSYGQWATVSVKDDAGRRPSDWAESQARTRVGLAPPGETGAEAARRTLEGMGGDKVASLELPLIVEARAVYRLLGGLLAPLSGQAIDQKRSCFEGKLGEAVASPLLSITDDPLLPGGWGSARFDGEGMTLKKRPLLEKGVLRGFYIDSYYARKLKVAPTTEAATNLVFSAGARNLAGLCTQAGKAVLVTRFIGGNSNPTTGDFSHGIAGFLIENGKRTKPLAYMNMAGNHLTFWKGLRGLGNDPYPHSPFLTPSLLFGPVLISGK